MQCLEEGIDIGKAATRFLGQGAVDDGLQFIWHIIHILFHAWYRARTLHDTCLGRCMAHEGGAPCDQFKEQNA
ncbi:hypothetical protein KSB_36500 [Ktedonobacter robiniae]|uniref:Uncharacterized protein n=1 Tax=Ktedonobacter robiniae TaxID=2778365 RepID=A0ABQ3URV3_9CHLR|nr:hypothetical protein KSB_36500 [Ktedonobacter robiniae]